MSFAILMISYLVTLSMGYLPCFRMQNETYFTPLCIACTFPNIVALPIIIFPTLCEYGVVQDLVREDVMHMDMDRGGDDVLSDLDENYLMDVCNKQVNSVVFTYFFGFSIVFWSVGHRALRNCKVKREQPVHVVNDEGDEQQGDSDDADADTGTADEARYDIISNSDLSGIDATNARKIIKCGPIQIQAQIASTIKNIKEAFVDIVTSTAFVALIMGFITACIGPLQRALFDAGGSLRVAGSALESLSNAGTTFATIVVAASLMKNEDEKSSTSIEKDHQNSETLHLNLRDEELDLQNAQKDSEHGLRQQIDEVLADENKIDDDGKEHGRLVSKYLPSVQRKNMKIYIWQVTSRLIVTPGIVFLLLLRLDCSGLLGSVPNIAKLVLLVNAAVPGALVVVVILKSEGLTDEAAAVSNTYLSSYGLSVVTLAIWCSIGLMAFRTDAGIC